MLNFRKRSNLNGVGCLNDVIYLVSSFKPTWETLNLNISALWQKLKNLVHKVIGKEFNITLSNALKNFFQASKLREEMKVAERHP